jgi:hypothetical protein
MVGRSAASPESVEDFLDRMLPMIQPAATEVHLDAAVLQVGEPTQLLELVSDPAIAPFLLCRLAPNLALVEPGRAGELTDVLRRRGHTPKVLKPRVLP